MKIFLAGVLLAMVMGLGYHVRAQPPRPPVHAVTQAAFQAGALTCVRRINQVVTFLEAGSLGTGSRLHVHPQDPDRNLLTVSMEILTDQPHAVFASATFAPNQAGDCGALYQTVSFWNSTCDDIAAKQFPGLKKLGVLRRDITVLDGGPTMKIYLLAVDRNKSCVAIKKEVVQ